jgi:DNA invertase Pin-like site-specific DNA recombinase
MDGRFVAYYRVSTNRQAASGLGLEAQQAAVASYLNGGNWKLVGEFTDVESGKRVDRPELLKAMELCRLTGSRLLIAKIDRLARNVHFLSGLMEQGVDFLACDMPAATPLTVHIMAAVAQAEREAISARTKAGLESIRQRIATDGYHISRAGRRITRLGNPNPIAKPDHAKATAAVIAKADAYAARVAPTIKALRDGALTLQAIADRLNELGFLTPRGAAWSPMAVKRIIDRADATAATRIAA